MAAGYTMTIDGKSVKGSKSTGVINPATGKIFAEVPDCSKAELDQAMAAAQKAFPSWSKDLNARRKVLQDCAAALQQPPEGLARTLTLEQGKPLAKAAPEWEKGRQRPPQSAAGLRGRFAAAAGRPGAHAHARPGQAAGQGRAG